MKIFKAILSIILFYLITFSSFGQDSINWRTDYKLKWADFQGVPDSNSSRAAVSTVSIGYYLSYDQLGFICKVVCYFSKKESWVVAKDSTLLEHERGHFDIAELFARKFRKKMADYKFSYLTVDQDVKAMFADISSEQDRLDSLYDKETNYSKNKLKQMHWIKKVKAELKKLEFHSE